MISLIKPQYGYILFFLQLFFIALFVLVLLAHNLDITAKSFLENRMMSDNARGIWMGDPRVDRDEGVVAVIPDIPNTEYMMYKHLQEGFEIMRGVYGTSDVFGFASYIGEGRFFESGDYAAKSDTVVVGSKAMPRTIEENGRCYLPYDGRLFEVLGVFSETGTPLDDTVYINLTSLLETMSHLALYYVDAKDSAALDRVIAEMQRHAAVNNFNTMHAEYESTVMNAGLGRGTHTMLLSAVTAAAFNLFITVIFFVTQKKYKVAVQKLYGMTQRDLMLSYGKSIFAVITAAFVSVVLVLAFLSQYMGAFFAMEMLAAYHYALTAAILTILGCAAVFFIVKLAQGVNISDTLKGR